MLKRRKQPFALLTIAVFLGIITANALLSYQTLRQFKNPIESIMDANGKIYDLCEPRPDSLLLREFNADGVLTAAVRLTGLGDEPRHKKTWHILGAEDGKVYLSVYDRINSSTRHVNSMISVCDIKSGEISTLYEIDKGIRSYTYSVGISDGALYFGCFEEDTFSISRLNLENGEAEAWGTVTVPFPMAWFAVAGGTLYAAAVDSSIYRYEEDGWRCIHRVSGRAAAVSISVAGSSLYLFSAHPDDGGTLSRLSGDTFEAVLTGIRDLIRIVATGDDTWIAMTEAFHYRVSSRGVTRTIPALRVPLWLLWDSATLRLTLFECLAAALVLSLIRRVLKRRRISLIAKLTAVYVPVFLLGAFLLFYFFARETTKKVMRDNINASLLFQAQQVIGSIDGGRFAQIDWSDPLSSDYYLELRDALTERSQPYELSFFDPPLENTVNAYFSYWVYRVDGSNIYAAICNNTYINQEQRYSDVAERDPGFYLLLEEKTLPMFISDYDKDDEGVWYTVQYPILDGDTLVGMLDVACPGWDINREADAKSRSVILPFVITFATMLAALIALLSVFLRALKKLEHGAAAVSGGNYRARVRVRNMDETGRIADAFNRMAQSVENAISGIQAVSQGYERFVPKEMLSILHKRSITEVKASDYVATRAMFLLLTSESFDSYREEQYLGALNHFYTHVLPVLSEYGGVVERFNGREMRALLICHSRTAIEASLAVLTSMNRLNAELQAERYAPVECGLLLANADSFLGVTGNETRLNMVLFSRFAYKTDDIREKARRYGCRLMVEQEAYDELGDTAARYRHRLLGYIQDGDLRRALYDFYDGDTAESIHGKDCSKALFEQAVGYYYDACYESARAAFIDILKQRQDDPASREYLKKSHARLGTSDPPDVLFTV